MRLEILKSAPIYTGITKIVVLVSEPVRGISRATELLCYSGFRKKMSRGGGENRNPKIQE